MTLLTAIATTVAVLLGVLAFVQWRARRRCEGRLEEYIEADYERVKRQARESVTEVL